MTNANARATTKLVAIACVLGLGALLAFTQTRDSNGGTGLRQVWEEPNLMGVWQAPRLGAKPGQDQFDLTKLESLYKPTARNSVTPQDDPALHCTPSAFPRAATYGWPIQILQRPGWVYIYSEAFYTYRIIPTNGKHLPVEYQTPLFFGDGAGHWDGDTLVVDVTSFNGKSWLASSEDKPTPTSPGVWPTSDAMHVTERWRRVDENTLEFQARVVDPTMLKAAWDTPKVKFSKLAKNTIYEVKCLLGDPEPEHKIPDPALYLKRFGRGQTNQNFAER